MPNILVTGAAGQIGSELVPALRQRYGAGRVVASDIRHLQPSGESDGPFEHLDCTNAHRIGEVVHRREISSIYHLAALLSAVAEEKPQMAWELNMGGLYTVLEVARAHRCAVFFPSSIAAFGPSTPRNNAPQVTIQRPTTMYGVTKSAGELLADYYALRFGVDVRGLRLPGLISHGAPPGGGTTDYAVDIFYQALQHKRYRCFLLPDTRLDMIYMPDAIDGIIRLMEIESAHLGYRNAFNVTAMNFTPEMLATEIRTHIPEFVMEYEVDPVRQAIADSWPRSVDDSAARADWGWAPHYDLETMTEDMLDALRANRMASS